MALFAFPSTTHPTVPSDLGVATGSTAMESVLDDPGPLQLSTYGVDWSANLAGLLNLEHPTAISAGMTRRDEPIEIYTHALVHPDRGLFLVDTGVSHAFVTDPKGCGVGWILRRFAGIADMHTDPSTADVISAHTEALSGVFLTHIHLDHVSGLPDIPDDVPIIVGQHEARAPLAANIVAQRTYDRLLDGRPPLQELVFAPDPDGRFAGVVDVFGDQALFAISTPGHTIGHISLVARTPDGPILLTGDTSHTRWGWDNDVEPGTYLEERAASRQSLHNLRALSRRHPRMQVRLGHQA